MATVAAILVVSAFAGLGSSVVARGGVPAQLVFLVAVVVLGWFLGAAMARRDRRHPVRSGDEA